MHIQNVASCLLFRCFKPYLHTQNVASHPGVSSLTCTPRTLQAIQVSQALPAHPERCKPSRCLKPYTCTSRTLQAIQVSQALPAHPERCKPSRCLKPYLHIQNVVSLPGVSSLTCTPRTLQAIQVSQALPAHPERCKPSRCLKPYLHIQNVASHLLVFQRQEKLDVRGSRNDPASIAAARDGVVGQRRQVGHVEEDAVAVRVAHHARLGHDEVDDVGGPHLSQCMQYVGNFVARAAV